MTTLRYFRATPSVYEMLRAQLDEAYGYPNEATKTLTAIPLLDSLPSDSQGRVYLAIAADYCEYNLPSEMLPGLLSSGAVEEVDAATYSALLPST